MRRFNKVHTYLLSFFSCSFSGAFFSSPSSSESSSSSSFFHLLLPPPLFSSSSLLFLFLLPPPPPPRPRPQRSPPRPPPPLLEMSLGPPTESVGCRGVQYVHWVMHKCIMVKVGGKIHVKYVRNRGENFGNRGEIQNFRESGGKCSKTGKIGGKSEICG